MVDKPVLSWWRWKKELSMANSNKREKLGGVGDWQPFATFVVEYQWCPVENGDNPSLVQYRTNSHIVESGENSEWEGIEGKPLMEWMLNHVVIQARGQLSSESSSDQCSVVNFPVLINLVEISVEDMSGHVASCLKGSHFSGFVSHESELSFNAVLDVQGAFSKERSRYCRTDFFAIRLADGKRNTLGSVVPEGMLDNAGKMTVTLKNVVLETGVYAIRVVAVLNDYRPSLDYMEGALLIVA